jgi:hypothetical protein
MTKRVIYTATIHRKWWQLWKPREWKETNVYEVRPGQTASSRPPAGEWSDYRAHGNNYPEWLKGE